MTRWEAFYREKLTKMFTEKKDVIDIGGGLRLDPEKNNRASSNNQWLKELMTKTSYKVLDKVPDYHPDILGDIHELPFKEGSVEAFACIAVLEHVEEPQEAVREMHRCLTPGGYCFIYVPFLFYYHPMKGYYKDFYRFTYDGLEYLTRDFSEVEIVPVRGPVATALNLFPLLSKRTRFFNWLDRWLKPHSRQVSGFYAFCVK